MTVGQVRYTFGIGQTPTMIEIYKRLGFLGIVESTNLLNNEIINRYLKETARKWIITSSAQFEKDFPSIYPLVHDYLTIKNTFKHQEYLMIKRLWNLGYHINKTDNYASKHWFDAVRKLIDFKTNSFKSIHLHLISMCEHQENAVNEYQKEKVKCKEIERQETIFKHILSLRVDSV